MKKNILLLAITIGAISITWSCNKKTDLTATYQSTEGQAYLKVIHAAPSFRLVTSAYRDSFNVFANNIKANATFLTYNSIFPSGNPYFAVPAGSQTIRMSLQGLTLNPDSVTVATFNKTLDAGSYYSFIVTDSLLKANEAQQMFIKDQFAATDTARFTARFVHAAVNDTLGKNVDVFSTLYNANIFTNIAPGTATPFIQLQYTVPTDVLIVRRAGTLFELARLTGASFGKTHAYTLLYKGYANIVTTGTKGRSLIQYTNL